VEEAEAAEEAEVATAAEAAVAVVAGPGAVALAVVEVAAAARARPDSSPPTRGAAPQTAWHRRRLPLTPQRAAATSR